MTYQEHVSGIASELEEILDLDDLEAKVYLNLLRAGPITASALAKELDIDQERALEILAQMDSEGMFDEIAKQNAIEEGNAVEDYLIAD